MMAEMVRTEIKRAATLVAFFTSFARVIGLGRLEKSLGHSGGW